MISIDGEESEGEEITQPGQEEPPPSPSEVTEEWDGHRVLGGVSEEDSSSKEQLEDSERVEHTTREEALSEGSDDKTAAEECKEAEEGKEVEEGKEAEESSLNAATIQLARQLSQELTDSLSPKSLDEDRFIAFAKDSAIPEVDGDVDDCILSAWLPSQWVITVLASGRKVPPEQLTRPGIIAITEKVKQ